MLQYYHLPSLHVTYHHLPSLCATIPSPAQHVYHSTIICPVSMSQYHHLPSVYVTIPSPVHLLCLGTEVIADFHLASFHYVHFLIFHVLDVHF
jgi:hypothetical protein